jgi:hypothetical protein
MSDADATETESMMKMKNATETEFKKFQIMVGTQRTNATKQDKKKKKKKSIINKRTSNANLSFSPLIEPLRSSTTTQSTGARSFNVLFGTMRLAAHIRSSFSSKPTF